MKKILFWIFFIFLWSPSYSEVGLSWAKKFGSTLADQGYSIVTDSNGNSYITGYFSGTTDFDPGSANYNVTSNGNWDFFILKLNNAGDFVWVKTIGGLAYDYGNKIILDNSNNIFITGSFNGNVDFDPDSVGTYEINTVGNLGGFILKLNSQGDFIWAKSILGINGGSGMYSNDLVFDFKGNIITTGVFYGTMDFDPNANVFSLTSSSPTLTYNHDIFVLKLDSLGNFIWAKSMFGPSNDMSYSIDVDGTNSLYLTGFFHDSVDFDPGPNTNYLYATGYSSSYLCKLNENGGFIYAKSFLGGTTSTIISRSVSIDNIGNVLLCGSFEGTIDFDPNIGVNNLSSTGGSTFILKLDSSSNLIWVKQITNSLATEIDVDELNNIYCTGFFSGNVDFDPGIDTFYLSASGTNGMLVNKLLPNGDYSWAKAFGYSPSQVAKNSIFVKSNDQVFCTGGFEGWADFDPDSANSQFLTSNGERDIFVLKLNQVPLTFSNSENSVVVYVAPNPASQFISLQTPKNILAEKLIITDISGKQILETQHKNILDIHFLPPGIYLLNATLQGKIYQTKFMKE